MKAFFRTIATAAIICAAISPAMAEAPKFSVVTDGIVTSEQVKAEIVRVFGDLVFTTVIPRNVRLAEAPSHGKPIMQYDKWSKGARAYKSLTKEVRERIDG